MTQSFGVARAPLAVALAAITLALIAIGASGVGLFFVLLFGAGLASAAVAPNRGEATSAADSRFSVIGLLPVGFLTLTAMTTTLALLSPALPVNVLVGRVGASFAWVLIVAVLVGIGLVRRGHVDVAGDDFLPAIGATALILLGVGVVMSHPFEVWSRQVAGSTDFGRHLFMMRELLATGGLDYGIQSYPRGIHSLVGTAWSASGGQVFANGWQAMESALWLMIVLLALSILVMVNHALRQLGIDSVWTRAIAVAVALLAYSQSMWITSLFFLGFVTSIFAGLILATAATMGLDRDATWFGTKNSVVWLAVSTGLMANGWTLLVPPIAAATLVAVAIAVRREGLGDMRSTSWLWVWVAVVLSAFAATPALASLVARQAADGDVSADLAIAGYSGLQTPDTWWLAAVSAALLTLVLLARKGRNLLVAELSVILGVGLTLVFAFARAGGGSLDSMNYYASKTMWSFSAIIMPLAIVGVFVLITHSLHWILHYRVGVRRTAMLSLWIGVLIVGASGILGRMSGTPNSLYTNTVEGPSGIPFQIPVVTELEARGIDDLSAWPKRPVVVWGIVPNADARSLSSRRVQFADQLSLEGSAWAGTDALDGNIMARAVYGRYSDVVCNYLRANPDSLRITGPNVAAGAPWLIDSGCPAYVVRPDLWISVPLDKAWLQDTGLDLQPYLYPTFDEYEQYQEQLNG